MNYEKIKNEMFAFIYLSRKGCSVCELMLPRIESLSQKYKGSNFYKIDLDEYEEAVGEFLIFSIPAFIVFSEGKELVREARFFNMKNIEEKLDKYYSLIFNTNSNLN